MAQELELRSSDYNESRVTIAGAAVVKGEFDTFNDVNGFHIADVAIGDVSAMITKASKVKVVKQAALAINAGDAVYFDTAAREADKTDTNVLIGYAIKSALAADTHVWVSFDGELGFAKA